MDYYEAAQLLSKGLEYIEGTDKAKLLERIAFCKFHTNDYESALDYLERYSDIKGVQKWIKFGLPLVYYNIIYKKQGEPRYYFLVFHPEKGILSWKRSFEEDDSGKRLKVDAARKLIQKLF